MASRDWNDGAVLEVTWSQKLTDFTILLRSGQVKVHKHVLAENSPHFEQKLFPSTTKRGSESGSERGYEGGYERSMEDPKKIPEVFSMKFVDQATVISLLEYMYAGKINDPETIETVRYGHLSCFKVSRQLLTND